MGWGMRSIAERVGWGQSPYRLGSKTESRSALDGTPHLEIPSKSARLSGVVKSTEKEGKLVPGGEKGGLFITG